MKEPVVMSWSGGKDSAMALDEMFQSDRYQVVSLLTSVSEEYHRISHHGVRESLLDEQAKAIGIPLRKVYLPSGANGGCTNEVYEAIMAEIMNNYRSEGISTVGFGDLFLEDLRVWREANLARVGMRGVFPIWRRDTARLAREFIALGCKPSSRALKCGSVQLLRDGNTTKRYCVTCLPASIRVVKTANSIPSSTTARFFKAPFPFGLAKPSYATADITRIYSAKRTDPRPQQQSGE